MPAVACTPANLPAKAARYQSLDMWRGIACLLMVVFHTTMQVTLPTEQAAPASDWLGRLGQTLILATARMWVGVPVFFVISGYCIMATLDSRRRGKGGLGDYILRRVRRIYPPYWIALAVAVIGIWAVEAAGWHGLFSEGRFTIPLPWEMTAAQWIGNLTLTETWRPLITTDPMSHLLPNTWTLCYEEQFYLVAGVLLWMAPRKIFTAAAIFTALSFVVKVVAHKLNVPLFGTFLDGRWLLIAAGIMVYYRINYATLWQGRAIEALLLIGVLTSDLGPASLFDVEPTNDLERLAGFGFALLISLLYKFDARIMGTAVAQTFARVGTMSYSVYLIHPLVAKGISYGLYRNGFTAPWFTLLVVIPACLAASLMCGWVFYQLVERWFLNQPLAARQSNVAEKMTAEASGNIVQPVELSTALTASVTGPAFQTTLGPIWPDIDQRLAASTTVTGTSSTTTTSIT